LKCSISFLDARCDIERLEHVGAHEIGEVANRFHGNGLVEQLQGLLVLDAEAAPEPGGILRKRRFDLDLARTQSFAQLGDVGTELGEVIRDG
jgi:hypothetical protein